MNEETDVSRLACSLALKGLCNTYSKQRLPDPKTTSVSTMVVVINQISTGFLSHKRLVTKAL